ncbi:MAG: tRNA (adenosine(37)-N6)-threonylcarbamoyltransferase complex dimerization subunit type 1 TsaB [Bacteroidales bacterium]|nr:tRNA (adenosine(37)-N6)-threonylcarbamoyltransferase complex dimerization subunit type 1 TsaB [Bacteroidales bacterium]MCR4570341.1 tRNA (adenosine(37)-N6)-threonylcarbamoyltransferase complex dimerization subunit type 1 TsaB [Bacteroidales bacterium]
MARILLLETSTSTLSVALSADGKVIAERVCTEPRQQASLAAPLVKEVLDDAGLSVADCDAVCVSKGPGSYTGLRVGVSTAKGLCFGAGIPLLSVGTLEILANSVILSEAKNLKYIIPMIDARRMEVYTAVFSPEGKPLTEVEAKVIGPDSFAGELAEGPVLFIGDGALKCREVLTSPNAFFQEADPLASAMAPLAEAAWQEKRFEDLAYFEPFYLKDFIATVSRKKLF